MRSGKYIERCRLAVAFGLLLAQAHLLSVVALHGHEPMNFGLRSSAVWQNGTGVETEAGGFILCTACQVIRQSAALPAARTSLSHWTVEWSRDGQLVFACFDSQGSATPHGRAPPSGLAFSL